MALAAASRPRPRAGPGIILDCALALCRLSELAAKAWTCTDKALAPRSLVQSDPRIADTRRRTSACAEEIENA